ncbi:MAG: pyruvate synthase [Thaumarchaeota archaeon]|nr:pyruvate synthase [Nitrososphaerota archaeon]
MKQLITGNAAVATAVKLCNVEYIPAYPITPQTEIIELLSRWINEEKMDAKFVTYDSEHSMISAAGAASLVGARTFTASSSQGLLYAFEMLYNVSGWRAPIVLANVSRAVASPITLEPDHNDVLAARDSGFLQIHAETCQEVLDSVIMAYKISEDNRVRLPVIVNLDGFYLSYTREPVDIPAQELVSQFLPEYKPVFGYLDGQNPISMGVTVLSSNAYSYFKYQLHLASLNALNVHEEISQQFEKLFGRKYGLVDEYMLDDADYVIVMTNSFATMGKAAINRLRGEGKKVGLLRIRMIRPFPKKIIAEKLAGKKAVGVIDQNISVGSGGILYPEITSALYHSNERPKSIISFIGGLGGKKISISEFRHILSTLETSFHVDKFPVQSVMLFTEDDWGSVKEMLKIAGKGEVSGN